MKIRNLLVLAALLVAPDLVQAQEFTRYHGKDTIQEGMGGEMQEIDGIEFWTHGMPPRRFQLLGYITDSRLKSGLIGMARMKGQARSVCQKAKEVGADAVVQVGSEVETTGHVSNAFAQGQRAGQSSHAFGSAQTTAVQRNHARFAVLKYLPDEPVTPAVER